MRHFASNRASARWSRSGLPATRVSLRRRVCSLLFGSSGRNGWCGFRFRPRWTCSPEWCCEGERTAGARKRGQGDPPGGRVGGGGGGGGKGRQEREGGSGGPRADQGVRPTKRVCLIEFLLEA